MAEPWIEVDVTIETTTEEKARYKVDRREFEDWAGDVAPGDLPRKIKEFLRAGDEWEVCAQVNASARGPGDVVDCEVLRVEVAS